MKILRIYLSSVLLVLAAIGSQAQTGEVKGKVLDAKTSGALPFSNIFINNTTLGVAADQNGNYALTNIPVGLNEIVFSFVGYQSYQKKIQVKAGESIQLDIRLVPDETVLETVVVSGTRDKEWDKQLKKFEKVFFGKTKFANSCKILNSWVLEFKESEVNGKSLFTATASRPLEIENSALGYKVNYYLKSLASTSDGYSIKGEVRFEELKNADPKVLKARNQNRLDAYYGSLRHLFKSIVSGKVKEEGFNLYTDKSGNENNPYRTSNFEAQLDKSIESLNTSNLLLPEKNEGEFSIQIKKRLEVHYTRVRSTAKVYSDIPYPVSWLQVNGGVLKVNAQGIVLNPASLVISGAMNDARVADLLPYNYLPEVAQSLPIITESSIQQKLNRLEEKVYLRTDKPYYYPGEKIWFKAYLNYRSPELMDSLSKVLYVELIDTNKKITQTRALFTDGGACDGFFELPDTLETGGYYLRAYTNWMLNYDSENIFVNSIPLLGLYECPEPNLTNTTPEATTLELKFKPNKPTYKPRERIKLEFELRNPDGTLIPADFSVSVTDMQQVVGIAEEKNILNAFPFAQNEGKTSEIKYPIESGISLAGEYKNKKGKPEKKSLAAVEGKFQNMKPIQTDARGTFWISGFQFYDSTEIVFQELGKKKKFQGTIRLFKRDIPSTEKLKKPVALRIIKSESTQRMKFPTIPSEKTILLKEVIINEENNEVLSKDNVPKVYAKADITIKGEDILNTSRNNLVNAIQSRVPGLVVVNGYLRIGTASNFMGPSTTEPMLIVDGLQFTGGGTDSNYRRLMQINPEIVDRVDVIKYGGAAIYGTRGGNGVIIVTTKGGEYGTINQTAASLQPEFYKSFKVAGFSRPSEFVSPDHSKSVRDFIPDNRSTLFWSPQVRTDDVFGIATVSFYAADPITKYKIVVEGITDFGEPVRGVFFVEISN